MTLSFIESRAPPANPQSFATPALKEHFVVPKTQHLVSLFSQKLTACFVLFHFGGVFPSVKLDYQAMFDTAESAINTSIHVFLGLSPRASKYAARGIAHATCARRARLTMTLTRARQARSPSP
jgi:hypothetical protein